MVIIPLVCIFVLALAEGEHVPYHGLMLSSSKSNFARDIMYIVKSIVHNARFWNYPSIIEERGNGAYKQGKYITALEMTNVQYHPELVWDNMTYDGAQHKVVLATTKPVVKYDMHLKWRVSVFSIDIAFGDANITFTSSNFKTSLTLPDQALSGSIEAEFKAEIKAIAGHGISDSIKQWIIEKMVTNTTIELIHAVKNNTRFLTTYIFWPYLKAIRKINNEHSIAYINKPVNSSLIGDNIWIPFDTEMLLDNKTSIIVNKTKYINSTDHLLDAGLYMTPELVIGTIELLRTTGVYDMEINLVDLGYSGMVKDFFEPMPELVNRYMAHEKARMYCRMKNTKSCNSGVAIHIFYDCNFTAASATEPFLRTTVRHRIPFIPTKTDDENQLFIAKFASPSIEGFTAYPQAPEVSLFLLRLFNSMGMKAYKDRIVNVPKLRYEPLRNYKKFYVPQQPSYYVAFYEAADY